MITLATARALGDAGMRQAQMRIEFHYPGFTERAAEFIVRYLLRHGPMPGEMLTDLCKASGIVATDDRAFGAVYKTLVRRGEIRQAGWCARTKGHGSFGGRIWEATA